MKQFTDKLIYQIYPRSFQDSNGDGIGDLQGIISRLDYLQELGVDYLWITPVFKSPLKDNGYDISDYRKTALEFGTMQDLDLLVLEAEKRGIGIIFDMVFNHSSTKHEWFQKALNGDKEYQDYYFFREGAPDSPPTNWKSKFGGSAWQYVPELGKWYLHLFDPGQADLNWNNPRVRAELKDIIRFWKEKGIKGFRFDVFNLISKPDILCDDHEGDGKRLYTDGPHVHEYIKELIKDTNLQDFLTVGELVSTDFDHFIEYVKPENMELNHAFNFHHLKSDYVNNSKWVLAVPDINKLKEALIFWQEGLQKQGAVPALFWNNHDQPRSVSRFIRDPEYWKEGAEMLALCLYFMRGIPYVYQGEEIGMLNAGFQTIDQYNEIESLNYYHSQIQQGKSPEDILQILAQRSRDNARTPMQWSSEINAGFTKGKPWLDLAERANEINVEKQLKDEDSILNFYKKLFRIRKNNPILVHGSIEFLELNKNCISYLRSYDDQQILVLCNLSSENIKIPVPQGFHSGKILLSNYRDSLTGENPFILRPYEAIAVELDLFKERKL